MMLYILKNKIFQQPIQNRFYSWTTIQCSHFKVSSPLIFHFINPKSNNLCIKFPTFKDMSVQIHFTQKKPEMGDSPYNNYNSCFLSM
jgi:hypothetical protein